MLTGGRAIEPETGGPTKRNRTFAKAPRVSFACKVQHLSTNLNINLKSHEKRRTGVCGDHREINTKGSCAVKDPTQHKPRGLGIRRDDGNLGNHSSREEGRETVNGLPTTHYYTTFFFCFNCVSIQSLTEVQRRQRTNLKLFRSTSSNLLSGLKRFS